MFDSRRNFEENKDFKPFVETDEEKKARLTRNRWPKEAMDIEI